jgi:beta-glucosidase-like glycosyl hydrolase
MKMVTRLQLGGVIPHYGSEDFAKVRATSRALMKLTKLPLLLCADIVGLTAGTPGKSARFGDGYVGGFIGKFATLGDSDFRTLATLNAFMFAAMGVNVALGPTVDDSTKDARTPARARVVMEELRRFGVAPVLKHFPFLPTDANLHRSSPDTRVPADAARLKARVFGELHGDADILMTTHTFDSLVDSGSIVTLSAPWHALMHDIADFDGLVMTDGLLMLDNYADKSVLGSAEPGLPAVSAPASWALRAILAGHDLIVLEGSIAVTDKVFADLLGIAKDDSETGARLRARIDEAYGSILRFKEAHGAALTRAVDAPTETIDRIIALAADMRLKSTDILPLAPVMDLAAVTP